MTLKVREIEPSEYPAARELLLANGWAHRVQDDARFQKLLDNSNATFVAYKSDQIVGFIRAITDTLSNGYISMLVVHPNYRRQGIGKSLVQAVINYCSADVTWTLRAGREGAPEFFAALGFRKSTEAMELKRQIP